MDDGAATVLSAILEAKKTAEEKVKMEYSGDPCFVNLGTYNVCFFFDKPTMFVIMSLCRLIFR